VSLGRIACRTLPRPSNKHEEEKVYEESEETSEEGTQESDEVVLAQDDIG
jgi:hypothetical protein